MGLELPRALERTLSTTNAIENLMSRARAVTRNVKRWRGGEMILRWMATPASEAEKGFRRLKGHAGVPKRRATSATIGRRRPFGITSTTALKRRYLRQVMTPLIARSGERRKHA